MPVNADDRSLLRTMHGLLADQPLQPGSEYYEPIYQAGLGLDDPVARMSTLIDFNGRESVQLFSGFRGSGKTTELLRLRRQMEDDGYVVLYADALQYVNAAEPIEISDLLIALAGAFSDALDKSFEVDIAHEGFWQRLSNFIVNTEVRPKEASVKAEAATPGEKVVGGIKAGIDLKFELKTGSSFKQDLQHFLANRLSELKRHVDKFFEDGIKRIRQVRGDDTQVVFLFDQLEQLQGTLGTERDVIRSVERIFGAHIDLLKIPYVHAVYTVPPWLKFILPAAVQVTLLPTVHLWNNDPERSRCEPAWVVFRSLVHRRIGGRGMERVFGPTGKEQARFIDAAIDVCGGHFRDLLRLLRDLVIRAVSQPSLPLSTSVLVHAIAAARRDFVPVSQEDAKWLDRIASLRATALADTSAETVNRLTRFLDVHWVLYFVNGDEWYDIHPLVRDEVASVLRAQAASGRG